MECPKCRKTVKDDDYICPYCGTNIKSAPESKKTAKVKPHKKKEKAKNDNANAETTEETLKKKRSLRQIFKLAAVIVCVVLIIILVIMVISSVISSKGEKYAQTAAEYIGSSLKTLESEEDITYKDESSYYGVNSAVEYDYVSKPTVR